MKISYHTGTPQQCMERRAVMKYTPPAVLLDCQPIVVTWCTNIFTTTNVFLKVNYRFLQTRTGISEKTIYWIVYKWSTRAPFNTNRFFIEIQIRWNFRFILRSIVVQWLLQNVVPGATAVLLYYVQKFVTIWWPATKKAKFPSNLNCGQKKSQVKRARMPYQYAIGLLIIRSRQVSKPRDLYLELSNR